jgi:hypothetical protein
MERLRTRIRRLIESKFDDPCTGQWSCILELTTFVSLFEIPNPLERARYVGMVRPGTMVALHEDGAYHEFSFGMAGETWRVKRDGAVTIAAETPGHLPLSPIADLRARI